MYIKFTMYGCSSSQMLRHLHMIVLSLIFILTLSVRQYEIIIDIQLKYITSHKIHTNLVLIYK